MVNIVWLNLSIYPTDQWSKNGVRDFYLYQIQGKGIVSGKRLYTEIPADMPPLLVYLLAIPFVMGKLLDPFLAYKLFYAVFAILGGIGFLYLSSFNDQTKHDLMLLYSFNPLVLANVFIASSDEILVLASVVWLLVAIDRKEPFWTGFLLIV